MESLIICLFLTVAVISPLPIKSKFDTSSPVQSDVSEVSTIINATKAINISENVFTTNIIQSSVNNLRPGMSAGRYKVEITPDLDEGTFTGELTVEVNIIDHDTLFEDILFHVTDLEIESVSFSFGGTTFMDADFIINEEAGILVIHTGFQASLYTFLIEYTGQLDLPGQGLYVGRSGDDDYIAMNLHPINARRVFPCIDEPNHISTVSFTFTDFDYEHIVSNSQLEANGESHSFMPLPGPVHTWGMVAHNLLNVNLPIANVLLYVRRGIISQDQQASAAINFFFTNLNEWTEKSYFEIILNQDEQLHILALPDTNRDWYALSSICIWEPYILMETAHSVRQRTTALMTISEAISRQWFGYTIYPQNFRFQWVLTGLAKYAAYQVTQSFQTDPLGQDVNLIDMKTIFTTEVIQESLLRDSYSSSTPMQPAENVFDEPGIRDAVNGLIRYKAPAIMNMFRIVLGDDEQDFIQSAARAMIGRFSLTSINAINFYDAINSEWLFEGNEIVPDVGLFAQPWVELRGYPLVHVGLRQGGLLLTQEHFSFTPAARASFLVPITYTTGTAANFDNIHPVMMLDVTTTLTLALGEDDYVLFNIQGQGYYRVNYDAPLWERIIEALYDEERREEIHPLNRATLVDDSLILARAGKIDYDTAFQVALSMELETDYAPWKAFVRNMNFLRKHLVFYVRQLDLDPDIYLRMIRRTIEAFEEEVGFEPDPNLNVPAMISLTRGLVMDHACRSNYDPCIAAAVDWFYNPNDNEEVNPNIPHELRPAVYCTMVREGDEEVIEALKERMEIEPTQYERLVILEAMACSEDEEFIQEFLHSTIDDESPYGTEERVKIFNAVVESNYENTNAALAFLIRNAPEIRQMYGGPEKLEDMLFVLADNLVDPIQLEQFVNWINSVNSNLDDSLEIAKRARDQVIQVMTWRDDHLEDIYEWIDENDAPTIIVSSILILISLCVSIFNH